MHRHAREHCAAREQVVDPDRVVPLERIVAGLNSIAPFDVQQGAIQRFDQVGFDCVGHDRITPLGNLGQMSRSICSVIS